MLGLKKLSQEGRDIKKVGTKEARLEWAIINSQWHKL
jgi:hypothetical protein